MDDETSVCIIPRSREVGQSYLTSIWTTLVALWVAFSIVYREAPQLVRLQRLYQNEVWHMRHSRAADSMLSCSCADLQPVLLRAGPGEWTWHMHPYLRCSSITLVSFLLYAQLPPVGPPHAHAIMMLTSKLIFCMRAQVDWQTHAHCVHREYCKSFLAVTVWENSVPPTHRRRLFCPVDRIAKTISKKLV